VTAYVLDASALLALFLDEEGADRTEEVLDGGLISAVNLSEVGARLADLGADLDRDRAWGSSPSASRSN